MRVTCDVVGEGSREVDLSDEATYAELVREVGYSVHEVTVLVDGRPVPEDRPVDTDADSIRVLRLVKGGGAPTWRSMPTRKGQYHTGSFDQT